MRQPCQADSGKDWLNECIMFDRVYKPKLPEDWSDDGKAKQCYGTDKRSEHLDKTITYSMDQDVALYGDGSFINRGCATYSAQPIKFGNGVQYFDKAEPMCAASMACLPERFGYEKTTVHTAELSAMLVSLRWRRLCQWNLFVGYRSALFSALTCASRTKRT